jgi:hypothetical protein
MVEKKIYQKFMEFYGKMNLKRFKGGNKNAGGLRFFKEMWYLLSGNSGG